MCSTEVTTSKTNICQIIIYQLQNYFEISPFIVLL